MIFSLFARCGELRSHLDELGFIIQQLSYDLMLSGLSCCCKDVGMYPLGLGPPLVMIVTVVYDGVRPR